MNRRPTAWVRIFVAALGAGLLWHPWTGEAQETYALQGDGVAVYNLVGAVEITAGSGGDVVVEVLRGGRDAQRLEIETREVEGRESLILRYPDDRIVYPELGRGSRTQIRVRSDGTFFGEWGWRQGRQVRISGSGSGLEAWADLRIRVPRGRDFALFLAAGETDLRRVDGEVLVDTGSGAVRAQGGSGRLRIDTGSGGVAVGEFQGDVEVDTGSGSVEMEDVEGGKVLVDTGSGSVRASSIRAESLEVDTGSGEIEVRRVWSPDIRLDTGSGSVEVELMQDVDRLEIDTGSGSIGVWVPEGVGAQVELETGSGGIDLDLPFEAREIERDYVRGILGDGEGRITIDTGSGGIRLMRR